MRALILAALALVFPFRLADAVAQAVDTMRASQDTATVDSALVARLQEELNWRTLIRVRADGTWLELAKPTVSPLGIDYESSSVVEPSLEVQSPLVRPIPLPMVLEIRVRKGHPKAGMIVGGVLAAAYILSWASALGDDGDGGDGLKPEGLLLLPVIALPGAVLGSFLGEAMATWQPVMRRRWSAIRRRARARHLTATGSRGTRTIFPSNAPAG